MDLFSLSLQLEKLAPAAVTSNLNRGAQSGRHDRPDFGIHELQALEEQVVEAVSRVKSLRNLTSPLNRLPSEILAHIFSFLQPPIPKYLPLPLSSNPLKDRIYVSHVCRHWRRTALSTPSLWSDIAFDNVSLELNLVCLGRSKSVPFRLFYSAPLPGPPGEEEEESSTEVESPEQKTLREILQDNRQIRELHVTTSWVRNSPLWGILNQPAPLLETIAFDMANSDSSEDEVSVLPRIFNDEMPSLKNVHLCNVSSWPYNNFRNLVRFSLCNQSRDSRPSLPAFLRFLAASSATLEELKLINAGPTHYEMPEGGIGVFDSAPRITLPALRYLEIGATDSWIAYGEHIRQLLSHTVVPSSTRRCFWETHQYLGLPDYFPRSENREADMVQIKRVVITSYDTAWDHSCLVGFDASTLYINFKWDAPGRIFSLVGEHSNYLEEYLANVEELVYAPGETWSKGFDREIFDYLPSLRTVKVSGALWSNIDKFLGCLGEFDCLGGDLDTVVKFKHAAGLENLYVYSDGGPRVTQSKSQVKALVAMAAIRLTNGCPLRTVVFDQLPEDEALELQDYVGCVIPIDTREGDETDLTREDILPRFWDSYNYYKEKGGW